MMSIAQNTRSLRTRRLPAYFRDGVRPSPSVDLDEIRWLYDDIEDKDIQAMKKDSTPSHWFIIDPGLPPRMAWTFFGLLLSTADAFMITFELSFMSTWVPSEFPAGWTTATWCATGFFALDLVLNFITGYTIDATLGYVSMRLSRIVVLYGSGWFWLDLTATIPWSDIFEAWLAESTGDVGTSKTLRFARFSRTFRLIRLTRLLRLLRLIHIALYTVNVVRSHLHNMPAVKHLFTIAGYCCLLFFLCHVNSCLFFILQPEFLDDAESLSDAYVGALFWSWTHLLAVAPIEPPRAREARLLSMLISSESVVILSFLLFRVTSITGTMTADRLMRDQEVEDASEFMERNDIDQLLQRKVRRFLLHKNSDNPIDMKDLLGGASVLYEQLCEQLYVDQLIKFPLLGDLGKNSKKALRALAVEVSMQTWSPTEVIFKKGAPADSLLMIQKGCIRVTRACRCSVGKGSLGLRSCGCNLDLLFHKGTWLGEKSLFSFSKEKARSNTAISDQFTAALVVSGDVFRNVVSSNGMSDWLKEWEERICNGESPGCPFCGCLDHWGHECPSSDWKPRDPECDASVDFSVLAAREESHEQEQRRQFVAGSTGSWLSPESAGPEGAAAPGDAAGGVHRKRARRRRREQAQGPASSRGAPADLQAMVLKLLESNRQMADELKALLPGDQPG